MESYKKIYPDIDEVYQEIESCGSHPKYDILQYLTESRAHIAVVSSKRDWKKNQFR
eukprot:UN11474